jgi:hypothetical protein
MTDMLKTIEPKTDQLNFDSFVGGVTKTIKVTKVVGTEGDQPISIGYENDQGKPYKPCKSMRRALVMIWGDKGQDYVGRSMTLYGDPDVLFGGVKVGGIRISHMTGITAPTALMLTNKKGSKKSFTILPLTVATASATPAPSTALAPAELDQLKTAGQVAASQGKDTLKAWWGGLGGVKQNQLGAPFLDELKDIAAKHDAGPVPAGDDAFEEGRE